MVVAALLFQTSPPQCVPSAVVNVQSAINAALGISCALTPTPQVDEFTDARVGRQEGDIDVHAEISDLIFLEPIRGIFERAAGELRFDGIADLRRYRATA